MSLNNRDYIPSEACPLVGAYPSINLTLNSIKSVPESIDTISTIPLTIVVEL